MMIRRRWWMGTAWAAAAVTLAVLLWWAFGPRPLEVEVASAQRRVFEQTVEDDGRARARERIVVGMPWAGELERLTFKEGQTLEAGEALMWVRPVEPTLQDARVRAEWAARGAAAQAAWQRAARQTEVALVAWQRAAVAASRAVHLAEQEFISRAQLEGAVLDLQRDERSWQAAQAAERAALHEVELARVMLGGWVRSQDRSRKAVPAADRVQVLRVMQPNRAVLAAGVPVLEVADVRNPEVVVPLLSQEALRVQPGALVRLQAWGSGGAAAEAAQAVEGRVRLVEPAATTKVSALGLEEQRINVVIDPSSPLPDGDGYSVRVRVVMQHEANALCVPVSAVFPLPTDSRGQGVFLVKDGRAQLQEVAVRSRGGGWVWLERGLEEGQAVVVYPPAALREGARVRTARR
jgi:HlyD family secretion protein